VAEGLSTLSSEAALSSAPVSLAPVRQLTFPDQQQDSRSNARPELWKALEPKCGCGKRKTRLWANGRQTRSVR